jgi:AraC-like DNA-binding protein
MGCTDYENVFLNRNDHKFKIPGYIVKRGSMANIVNFFKEKVDNSIPILEPVICSKIVELLYYLNTSDKFEEYDSINEITQEIITYIDENFETISNIESVTKNFFYSKNHICHLFKKHTGITITKYINIKKMENVEKLYNQGKSLTHACIESGFKSYDSFAYIYKKEFGIPPKKGFAKTMENGTKFTI